MADRTLKTLLAVSALILASPDLLAQSAEEVGSLNLYAQRCVYGDMRPAERIALCTTVINRDILIKKELVKVYVSRAHAYRESGNQDAAFADLGIALRTERNEPLVWLERGNLYNERRDFSLAVADYTRAIQLNPHEVVMYINRGQALRSSGDVEGAIEDYGRVIAMDPTNANRYLDRASLYLASNQFEAAIRDLSDAIRLEPTGKVYDARGAAYEKSGDLDKALADYTEAVHLQPTLASSYAARGRPSEGKGRVFRTRCVVGP